MEWISVKDRLPNVNKTGSAYEEVTVIAYIHNTVIPMHYVRCTARGKTSYHWKWMWDSGNYSDLATRWADKVTHWMPMPDPPKEVTP